MSHEEERLDSRTLMMSGGVLLAVVALVVVLCFFLWSDWARPPSRLTHKPPAPALQDRPARDLASFRRAQRNEQAWGWVDREHGVARIPVSRAMALMSEDRKP